MPELPEVETISNQLNKVLVGKKIMEIVRYRDKSFVGNMEEVRGKEIRRIYREGKMVVVDFSKWKKRMIIHLKMTGQLIWRRSLKSKSGVVGGHPSSDWVRDLPSKHTRVEFVLSDKSRLFFNDMRVFGWIKVITLEDWKKILKKLPPDVVDKEFTFTYFRSVFKNKLRAVKSIVMDSGLIGGAGNIYANDALNLAKINPFTRGYLLKKVELERLYRALKVVINKGIMLGGASYSDYKDIKGMGGKYQDHFLVYKREGLGCKQCEGVIIKKKLGGRGTYFCDKCQSEERTDK